MRYFGFAVREHYLGKAVDFAPDMAVLEIGVGAGKAAEILRDRVKEFWGVDHSAGLVEMLREEYGEGRDARFFLLDVCDERAGLGKKFDVVFSLDTLEHVPCPGRFFVFFARHLGEDGQGVVLFPNESAAKHHGVTWFEEEEALREVVEEAELEVVRLVELKMTAWHRVVKAVLWGWPKSLAGRAGQGKSREAEGSLFDETESFRLARRKGPAVFFPAVYAGAVSRLARLFPLYRERELTGGEVRDKRLLLLVRKK